MDEDTASERAHTCICQKERRSPSSANAEASWTSSSVAVPNAEYGPRTCTNQISIGGGMLLSSSQVPSVVQQQPGHAPFGRGTSRGLISVGGTDHGVVSSLEAELGSVGRQVDADAHGQPLPVLKAGDALERQFFAHDVDVWIAGLLRGAANRGVSCTCWAQSIIGIIAGP